MSRVLRNVGSESKPVGVVSEAPNKKRFDRGLEKLQKSAEWKCISAMSEVTNGFSLFSLLEDAVCENAWSRIINFLFDSSGDHALGLRPLSHWIAGAVGAPFPDLIRSAKATTSETEWGTLEGRRLDILVKLLDGGGHLLGVIGIENKVWSGEQYRQLSAYQTALTDAFHGVPKILVFLTPDKREPLTASKSSECRVQSVSYESVVKLCDLLMPDASGDLRLLISSLSEFITRNILHKEIMRKQIKDSVAKLYQDPEKRRVIELIVEHRPTVRAVLEEVASSVEGDLEPGGLKMGGHHDYWPKDDDFSPELRLWPNAWNAPKGSAICYMLRSRARKPFIGDKFTVLLTADCKNDAVRRRMEQLRLQLPPRHSHKWKRWSGWEVLWEGETYQLRDLGSTDIQQLTAHLADAVQNTFEPLRAALSRP
jgi:hypothetical protein